MTLNKAFDLMIEEMPVADALVIEEDVFSFPFFFPPKSSRSRLLRTVHDIILSIPSFSQNALFFGPHACGELCKKKCWETLHKLIGTDAFRHMLTQWRVIVDHRLLCGPIPTHIPRTCAPTRRYSARHEIFYQGHGHVRGATVLDPLFSHANRRIRHNYFHRVRWFVALPYGFMTHEQVFDYAWERIFKILVPGKVWGCTENVVVFKRLLMRYISANRFDEFDVQEQWQQRIKGNTLDLCFLIETILKRWLQKAFYITDSNSHRHRIFYYVKKDTLWYLEPPSCARMLPVAHSDSALRGRLVPSFEKDAPWRIKSTRLIVTNCSDDFLVRCIKTILQGLVSDRTSLEHIQGASFLLKVDIKKAYDSIDRNLLMIMLRKLLEPQSSYKVHLYKWGGKPQKIRLHHSEHLPVPNHDYLIDLKECRTFSTDFLLQTIQEHISSPRFVRLFHRSYLRHSSMGIIQGCKLSAVLCTLYYRSILFPRVSKFCQFVDDFLIAFDHFNEADAFMLRFASMINHDKCHISTKMIPWWCGKRIVRRNNGSWISETVIDLENIQDTMTVNPWHDRKKQLSKYRRHSKDPEWVQTKIHLFDRFFNF
jgi:hypothetical protein